MRRVKAPGFEKLAELIREIGQTPKVDVIIMSPEVWGKVKKALPDEPRDMSSPGCQLGALRVFLHPYLGDVIVYGSSENKLIKTILSTCLDAV